MTENKWFSSEEVLASNLSGLTARELKCYEARLCELAEYARIIAERIISFTEGGIALTEAFSLVGDTVFNFSLEKNSVSEVSEVGLGLFTSALKARDRALFSVLLLRRLKEFNFEITSHDIISELDAENTVTYVKSNLADEAFDVFSEELGEARVAYSENFKEACFAVSSGKVGYCILPLEELGGVRIAGISSLLCELGLKIISITPVFGPDGEADVKYALIGALPRVPEVNDGDELYIEVSMPLRGNDLSEHILAGKSLGASLYRISTLASRDGDITVTLIFQVVEGELASFLTYYEIFSKDYEVCGIYKNIE